jgi:hypothetical protein
MNFHLKQLLMALALILLLNLLIFFNREKGFAYIKYADKEELYPAKPAKRFLLKWSDAKEFSNEEIEEGLSILKKQAGIDTILSLQDKVVRIAAWVYSELSHRNGKPGDTLKKLTPLQQYLYLKEHKDEKIWCGNFQSIFGFFSSCIGLPKRYVELVPETKGANGYHEINEVFLPDQNKWIMVDITRNMLLIKKGDQIFSAADYLDHKIKQPTNMVLASQSIRLSPQVNFLHEAPVLTDSFFNSKYALRYYKTLDLSGAYNPMSKIKRYIFGSPLYQMYDPVHPHSNFLFRIRQLFLFALLVCLLLFLPISIKKINP